MERFIEQNMSLMNLKAQPYSSSSVRGMMLRTTDEYIKKIDKITDADDIVSVVFGIIESESIDKEILYEKCRQKAQELNTTYPLTMELLRHLSSIGIEGYRDYIDNSSLVSFYITVADCIMYFHNDTNCIVYYKVICDVFNAEPNVEEAILLTKLINTDYSGVGAEDIYEELAEIASTVAETPDYLIIDEKVIENETEEIPQLDIEKIRSDVEKATTPEEQSKILEYIEKELIKLRQNVVLARLYGPCNPSVIIFDAYEHLEDYIHGGPRMMTDIQFEVDEYTGEGLPHWFTGSCDHCRKKILKMVHAVREPVFTGGWKGCYCSWDCVIDMVLLPVADKDDEERLKIEAEAIKANERAQITLSLIYVYKKFIEENKIYEVDFEEQENEDIDYTHDIPTDYVITYRQFTEDEI